MEIQVVPIEESHLEGFHQCLGRVASERKYLAFLEAPPIESARDFVLNNIRQGNPQFVALDADKVVGWCDIDPSLRPVFAHIGVLGMGLDQGYRGRGIGRRLMRSALDKAREKGLEKVELTVLASNVVAMSLYEKMGFQVEGRSVRKFKVDGRYEDLIAMGKFLADS